jgi:hypothetical protein
MSTTAAATPDHASSLSSGDAVTDNELGADLLFGFLVGTPLIYLTLMAMCLVAGTSLGNALAVPLLPCFLSGIFFGGVLPLSRQMARHEAAEREARRAVAPVHALADVVEVKPAA